MGTLRIILAFLTSMILVACAAPERKTSLAKGGYVPLSEAEAKIYTTPTLYYVPQFDLTKATCSSSQRKDLKDRNESVLFSVCEEVYNACLLQGTCELKTERGKFLVNVAGRVNSEHRFAKVQNKDCHYGFGAGKSVCLDPFYSLAADLSIYKLGQVIYIPTVAGLQLPDGTHHDGYFIVRDSGGRIKGYGRFDFFTGFLTNQAQNPLSQIGFGDKETHVQYYVLDGDEAEKILKKRRYPSIPVSN